jgi:hypothetical protein
MSAAAAILFLIPMSLIVFSGIRMKRSWDAVPTHDWRDRLGVASAVVGCCAILLGYAGKVAWLRAGGDPHGMGTPNGVWVPMHKLFFLTLAIGAILAIIGRGSGRALTLIAIGVAFVADTMLYILQME